ncbi:DsbA family oxidoreductase [Pseudonocardia kongjuensis]|uniref:DsbA family oxidoreductase n=1 Tax=Pseudonocardia kongjuensis TaxID=102227 RepID=A0ABP4IHU9_9PSEU
MVDQAPHPGGSTFAIEFWSDLGCPWCYLGKHRLRTAIARRPDAGRFEIRVRSFELNPAASREPETIEQAFIRTHGGTAADVLRGEQQIQAVARSEGLPFTLDRLSANTFDLHRVVQYATDQGLGFEFFSGVQDGFFSGDLDPYAPAALAAAAESAGIDGRRVREILAGDEYADRVRADRAEGLALGATGVPFVVIDRRVGAPGAQAVQVYAQLLAQVAGPVPVERAS